MKRLSLFFLLIGIVVGFAVQQPAQALGAPMGGMDMASMSESEMASMPDCMASAQKDADQKPCKCGMARCIAMMASGAPMMLADASMVLAASVRSERDEHIGISAALRGRSTAPEPEPPTILI